MNRFLQLGLTAGALVAAMPAHAAGIVEFNDPVAKGTNSGDVFGNVRTFTTTVDGVALTVKATAWTRLSSGTGDTVQAAYLGQWTDSGTGSGLGALTRAENTSSAPSYSHQVDNLSGADFIVLQFSTAVKLTGGILNAYQINGNSYTDNDAFIGVDTLSGAWNQTLNLTSWNAISSGLNGSATTNGTGAAAQSFNLAGISGKSGNMWIIGAATPNPDRFTDAFKLAQITVTAVPEPATWGMMLIGFGMVAGAARYRRRGTRAVVA